MTPTDQPAPPAENSPLGSAGEAEVSRLERDELKALSKRIEELTAERDEADSALVLGMGARSMATGHGDTLSDLIGELFAHHDERLQASEARATRAEGERDEARRKIGEAREAFLAMIADASRWDEDVDGDTDGEGGTVITVCYHLTTDRHQLEELVVALGIPMAFDEGAGDAIQRALEAAP